MIRCIWNELNDKPHKRKNSDIKLWDYLDEHDVHLPSQYIKKRNTILTHRAYSTKKICHFQLHALHDQKIWFDKTPPLCDYERFKEFSGLRTSVFTTPNDPPNNENVENKNAFEDFLRAHLDDPAYKNKFIAFVNGKFQAVGDKRNALIDEMYDKFGNVDMYVDKVTDHKQVILIDTPEFN